MLYRTKLVWIKPGLVALICINAERGVGERTLQGRADAPGKRRDQVID